ncbi:SLAP domain-containing protein [Lacticaseibacillus zhaodongensis]|uniref:SLAP domain-containing protein n=1 Tax=Lacticaseibacillus zhaodongensis TaxID=2668065 RepID=UPI0012D2B753|nr:SLAP domain-containing protein [Lacticaseibacillus zhaodongensis]
MTNKKFTIAAVVAAAITAAPIAAPAIGAIAPVFAATSTTATSTATTTSTATGTKAITNGTVKLWTGNATAKVDDTIIYNDNNFTIRDNGAGYAQKYTTYTVTHLFTRKSDGAKFYMTDDGKYLPAKDFNFTATGATAEDTTLPLGAIKINYNKNYGIQVWTKEGKMVRFNDVDAASWNKAHPKTKVKVGDPKKLTGQTTWKVFNDTYTAHGTTYYNLGGDQYIDASYCVKIK